MNNKLVSFIMFAAGAVIGSIVTYKCVKKKYETLSKEEIASVKEAFARREYDDSEEELIKSFKAGISEMEKAAKEEKAQAAKEKKDVVEYAAILKKNEYKSQKEEIKLPEYPYVIPPEDFGEMDGYDTISLTYYADEVLTDSIDMIEDDVEGTVGVASLSTFGEYEDDSVYVRNDRLRVDFEILRDLRTYSDVLKKKPYLRQHLMEE